MIKIQDFDEIVIDNPFLTSSSAYGIRKRFYYFVINYNPHDLNFYGQDNSTCKYITIENNLTNVTYKIIREDNHIEIYDFSKKCYVTDTKKLAKIENKFNDLKKIVKKQIEEHKKILNGLENLKIKFDFDTIKLFLEVLQPEITEKQQEKIIKKLAKIEKKPMSYFSEPTDTIGNNSKNIVKSLFFNVFVAELEKIGALIVVDWRSPYEEVAGLILPILKKMEIAQDDRLKESEDYDAENFLNSVNLGI